MTTLIPNAWFSHLYFFNAGKVLLDAHGIPRFHVRMTNELFFPAPRGRRRVTFWDSGEDLMISDELLEEWFLRGQGSPTETSLTTTDHFM